MIKNLIIGLFLCFIFSLEYIRFKECIMECNEEREQDQRMAFSDVCIDTDLRLKLKRHVDCESPEKRLALTIWDCRIQKYIKTSLLGELYAKATYFYVLVAVLPIIFWYMWLWSRSKSDAYVVDKMHSIYKDINRNAICYREEN
jgi:hypothetical protein